MIFILSILFILSTLFISLSNLSTLPNSSFNLLVPGDLPLLDRVEGGRAVGGAVGGAREEGLQLRLHVSRSQGGSNLT